MLLSAYPTNEFDDPKAALASFIEVLSGYSDAIVQHVTSNKTGIQRRLKFPPRLAELVAACDEAASILERTRRYQNWGRPQEIEGPKGPRMTKAEMEAKYGPNYGLDPIGKDRTGTTQKPAPTWDQIKEMYGSDPSRIAALTDDRNK